MRTGSLLLPLLVAADVLDGCLSGLKCRITSVTKCKSAALSHLGTMMASRYSPLSTSVRSFNAKPVSTLFIRTHISLIPDGRCLFSISRRFDRASAFICGATLSSRSYVTLSACMAKDFSSIFFEEDGTVWRVSCVGRAVEAGGCTVHARPPNDWGCHIDLARHRDTTIKMGRCSEYCMMPNCK
jgi:hypothetical protein